ncbi:hypothetical protein E4631_24310 [Hymenobacter sp. UV11]|uniref:RHS repeat domain-containing protein n=1 Tax=Hymenobacter sp. UV11 TaxID=1849735 RepID=UPI00105F23B5|nr:RHS repeat domain-containing protein [Hymenobacter sp. UV11]TDN39907.1 hypothetical protein A8B98_16520 [Hymenobacter sp. UV11]TFZ62844.1 hypothetical protein E4631_24310 [Hymenobacter sp. UV11]
MLRFAIRLRQIWRSNLLLGLLINCYSLALAQSSPSFPLVLANRNLLPLSPEAASLGRYGDTPVSLYTGVPAIEIPLYTLRTSNVEVPVKLQYHGGGVRLDQKATWVGLGWSLSTGGVVTHVCRGIFDGAKDGFTNGAPRPPAQIPDECGIARTPGSPSYHYVQEILAGRMDTQADLYSFNFLSYSGSFVLDQQGVPHLLTLQPLRIEALAGNDGWQFTTPDGTAYRFATTEFSQPLMPGGPPLGASAWYLTSITTRFQERVSFQYGDYESSYDYPPNYPGPAYVQPLPTATTGTWYHSCGSTDLYSAECSSENIHLPYFSERPGTYIRGKYLRRVSNGSTRLDFFSSAGRADGAGLRQLDSVHIKYVPDSLRFKSFRLTYAYPDARLALQQVTETGYAPASRLTMPPYQFFYNTTDFLQVSSVGTSVSIAPGSPSIDRWGYFNGQPNKLPFLAYKDIAVNLPGANREVNTQCVTFGLLRRIVYPTGGQTDYAYESNDFRNVNSEEFYLTLPTQQAAVCVSNPDPDNSNLPNCGQLRAATTFRLSHAQQVTFTWEVSSDNTGAPLTDLDVDGILTDSLGTCSTCPSIHFATDRQNKPLPISAYLAAGTYSLAIELTTPRFVQFGLSFSYEKRQALAFRGKLGGGTRIKRITTYDGVDHQRDQEKEYYYHNEENTQSTGRHSHDMAFASWIDKWTKTPSGTFGQDWVHERFLQRSALDVLGAAGTTAAADVGYDTVTVLQRSQGQVLKEQSVFVNDAPNFASLGDNTSVYPAYTARYNFFEQNGRLLRTLRWRVQEGSNPWQRTACRLVQRVDNTYADSVVCRVDNLLVGGDFGEADSTNAYPCRAIKTTQYTTQSFWSPLVQRTERNYSQVDTTSLATTTRWRYGSLEHQQPVWEARMTGAGVYTRQRFKYAGDYASTVPAAALLLQQQLLTVPLETQQWQQPAAGQPSQWTGGSLMAYAATSSGGLAPTRAWQAELPAPRLLVMEPQNSSGAFLALTGEAAYRPRASYLYYGTGEVAEQHLLAQSPASYLWGYDQHHLIARAPNAPRERIAVTSFEPAGTGRWRYDSTGTHRVSTASRTGHWAYRLDGTASVSRGQLPAGDYELGCWVQGALPPALQVTGGVVVGASLQPVATAPGDWHQYRGRVHFTSTGQVNLDIAPGGTPLLLDELRLHPVGAQLTTYTHDPLIGITSQTDPTGRTVTYEYDALGRLIRTRDEQGRILSQQQYHYAGTK